MMADDLVPPVNGYVTAAAIRQSDPDAQRRKRRRQEDPEPDEEAVETTPDVVLEVSSLDTGEPDQPEIDDNSEESTDGRLDITA